LVFLPLKYYWAKIEAKGKLSLSFVPSLPFSFFYSLFFKQGIKKKKLKERGKDIEGTNDKERYRH
jgi:hypothetical protein